MVNHVEVHDHVLNVAKRAFPNATNGKDGELWLTRTITLVVNTRSVVIKVSNGECSLCSSLVNGSTFLSEYTAVHRVTKDLFNDSPPPLVIDAYVDVVNAKFGL